MEEVRATGADTMLTSCPKCVSHFECLKFEGDEAYADIEILDVVSFLARQVNEQKAQLGAETTVGETAALRLKRIKGDPLIRRSLERRL